MKDDALAKHEPSALLAETSMGMMAAIAKAAANPDVDPAKMRELLAIQREILNDQRRQAFWYDLAQLQAEMPHIEKTGKIHSKNGQLRSTYAKLEDIDEHIRPLLKKYGFSFSFDSHSADGKVHVFVGYLAHRDGWTEKRTITLPTDTNDYRSAIQNIGSSESYAKRRLIRMHLNIVERGEDDDGSGQPQGLASADQIKAVRALMAEAKADEAALLAWIFGRDVKDPSLEMLLAKDVDRVTLALEEKKSRAARGTK